MLLTTILLGEGIEWAAGRLVSAPKTAFQRSALLWPVSTGSAGFRRDKHDVSSRHRRTDSLSTPSRVGLAEATGDQRSELSTADGLYLPRALMSRRNSRPMHSTRRIRPRS